MDPQIFRIAAEKVANGQPFACIALMRAKATAEHLTLFRQYFEPEHAGYVWFQDNDYNVNRDHRVLSLLLMAEIAEDL